MTPKKWSQSRRKLEQVPYKIQCITEKTDDQNKERKNNQKYKRMIQKKGKEIKESVYLVTI